MGISSGYHRAAALAGWHGGRGATNHPTNHPSTHPPTANKSRVSYPPPFHSLRSRTAMQTKGFHDAARWRCNGELLLRSVWSRPCRHGGMGKEKGSPEVQSMGYSNCLARHGYVDGTQETRPLRGHIQDHPRKYNPPPFPASDYGVSSSRLCSCVANWAALSPSGHGHPVNSNQARIGACPVNNKEEKRKRNLFFSLSACRRDRRVRSPNARPTINPTLQN